MWACPPGTLFFMVWSGCGGSFVSWLSRASLVVVSCFIGAFRRVKRSRCRCVPHDIRTLPVDTLFAEMIHLPQSEPSESLSLSAEATQTLARNRHPQYPQVPHQAWADNIGSDGVRRE